MDSVWDYPGEPAPERQNQGKTNLDLLEQDSEWQWHHLGHVQICTLTQTQPRPTTTKIGAFLKDSYNFKCSSGKVEVQNLKM